MKAKRFTVEQLKVISKFIANQKTISGACHAWNNRKFGKEISPGEYLPVEFPEIKFNDYGLKSLINDVRNDPALLIGKRLFNRLPVMSRRDWTIPEEVIFYIYMEYCINNGINNISSIVHFHYYSARSTDAIILKTHQHSHMATYVGGFVRSEMFRMVDQMIEVTSSQDSLNFINDVYQHCQKQIDSELKRCFKITTGDLKITQPEVVVEKESGFGIDDLVKKYSKPDIPTVISESRNL